MKKYIMVEVRSRAFVFNSRKIAAAPINGVAFYGSEPGGDILTESMTAKAVVVEGDGMKAAFDAAEAAIEEGKSSVTSENDSIWVVLKVLRESYGQILQSFVAAPVGGVVDAGFDLNQRVGLTRYCAYAILIAANDKESAIDMARDKLKYRGLPSGAIMHMSICVFER